MTEYPITGGRPQLLTRGPRQLRASEVYGLYRPSLCELRVWLRRSGEREAAPGPYDQVLRRLGERHERAHLRTLEAAAKVVDLSGVAPEERELRTREAVRAGAPVVYQSALSAVQVLEGVECRVVGYPDFLVRDGGGYVIRDSKLARKVGPRPRVPGARGKEPEPAHPKILRQIEIYGWLYERAFGEPPVRLEVHAGTGDLIEVPYDGGTAALDVLATLVRLESQPSEPYSPVGWSKCGRCGFRDRCWPRALARQDVALVREINQDRAAALRGDGVETVHQLLERFDESRLAAFSWQKGARTRRMGDSAATILLNARVLASGAEVLLRPPAIPRVPRYAMFDVEGLPPQLDELEKVYLWGLQVFGEPIEGEAAPDKPGDGDTTGGEAPARAHRGEFLAATAGFGEGGDRAGWEGFVANARSVLAAHGDLPFVHWSTYERTKLDTYVGRYGDLDGVAARVRANLLDLCSVTEDSIVLPLSSYSLKVVEKYVGFERTLPEYGGEWAMASYIEAVETESADKRQELMREILAYNREDLEATWAVLRWLRGKACNAADTGGP